MSDRLSTRENSTYALQSCKDWGDRDIRGAGQIDKADTGVGDDLFSERHTNSHGGVRAQN